MNGRCRVPEVMDNPTLDRVDHEQALRGLARINACRRSVPLLWKPIEKMARAFPGRLLRVLDLACGGGDVARGIARRARAAGLPVEVYGADISNQALELACERSFGEDRNVRFFQLDALADPIPEGFDVLTCTLFLHHLSDEEASLLLGKMAASTGGMVLVDDLIRSRAGYALAWAGCRLLSRSKMIHHDGPASVSSAFRVDEVRAMADSQRLTHATIQTHWTERFLFTWSRPT